MEEIKLLKHAIQQMIEQNTKSKRDQKEIRKPHGEICESDAQSTSVRERLEKVIFVDLFMRLQVYSLE